MAQADDANDPLLTDTVAVRNHGDGANSSVGVVIPADTRDILGVTGSHDLFIHVLTDRLVVTPHGEVSPDNAHGKYERSACPQSGGSLQVNVPSAGRRILGLERGDRMRAYSYPKRIEFRPAIEALGMEEIDS